MHSENNVIVIGAGPAGLACAYELSKAGIPVKVFEASESVGGMSKTIDLWGQKVDLGPHRFFSKDKSINGFFKELVQDDYTIVKRLTRIYYKKRFFLYPLDLFNVLKNLNIFSITQIILFYVYQRIRPIKNPQTFEEWVTNRFGKKLFEMFFKSYSEKLWGIPCAKIDADWAAQRIKKLSFVEAVLNAIKTGNKKKHATLVDEFAYPNMGTGVIYERAKEKIIENGGNVYLKTKIKKVLFQDGKAVGVELMSGETHYSNHVVSTMPLTLLIKGIENLPAKIKQAADQLYFRNTILVYIEVDGVDLFDDNWLYIHSPDVKHGRVTNFRNWSPQLYGDKKTSILCLEYWAFDTDDIWSEHDEAIAQLGVQELQTIKLISEDAKILNTHIIRVPKCYPVYETGYKDHLSMIEKHLDTIPGLIPIGRYGSFKYNNQDHSILMGILAARKIADNEPVNLWEINTDTEYQEDAKAKDVLIQ